MKRLTLALLLAAAAFPAAATWFPTITPNEIHLVEGETIAVDVRAQWSGLTDYGFSPWTFISDREGVAVVTGRLGNTRETALLNVRGVAPGEAGIRVSTARDAGPFASITVHPRVHIAVSTPRPRIGEPVTLTAVCPSPDASFTWYRGETRTGEGRELAFVPERSGSVQFRVEMRTRFVISNAAVTIEVPEPERRRSVRH